jgi:formate dehydrogenase maturation protein FdhE
VEIRNSDFQHHIQNLPEYREPLDFLQRILDFQAGLVEKIEPQLHIEPTTALERWHAGGHLLENRSMSIPLSLFREALSDLRPILPPEAMQLALNQLLDSGQLANCRLQIGDFELQILESEVENRKPKIQNLDACIQQVAHSTASDPDTVAFLFRTVLSPFFKKQAIPYQGLVEMADWRCGICPMCGSEPWLARLSYDDGQRILACSLCHTEWPFDRLRCPFCAGNGQPQLRHFTVDSDEVHRVDCCDHCRRFIKTIDERVLGRPANLPAEDVITSHLDTLAQEQGYI